MFVTPFSLKNLQILLKPRRFYKISINSRLYNDVFVEDIPSVSPTIIKQVLRKHNLAFDDGFTCFITTCPLCGTNGKTTQAKKIYINKITGYFSCPSCMQGGQWDAFEEFINIKEPKKLNLKESIIKSELDILTKCLQTIQNTTKPLKTLPNEALCKVWNNFKLPIVPATAIEQVDVRIDDSQNNLYFPLENVNSQIIGYRILNSSNSKDVIEPSISFSGLLCGKTSKPKDAAILVPNISDFLVLLHAKISANIVCLPNGLKNLPQQVLPNLERFKKLILWFGSDVRSWQSARNFAKKLGDKRCLFVRPTEKQPLPHLAQNQDLKAIVAAAQPIWHKSITTFSSLREDILADLQNIDKVQGVKWKRYPTLSRIVKGHRTGELTVLTGPTGCGKTTFMSEYSLDLAMQGVNTLWGSFEIRNARLAKTMLQQMAGIPLEENVDRFDVFADEFEKLPVYFMTFHGQQSIKVVMEAVEHATYVHDIGHVIIDNVQFMMGMTEELKHMDRFWKQDAIIAAFRQFSTRKNCHVTLVIHPRKEREDEDLTTSSIFGGAKASQEADNIFIIQDKRLTSVRGKKYLQVAKNRYSGDLGVMALEFDKKCLSYAQKKKKVPEEKPTEAS